LNGQLFRGERKIYTLILAGMTFSVVSLRIPRKTDTRQLHPLRLGGFVA